MGNINSSVLEDNNPNTIFFLLYAEWQTKPHLKIIFYICLSQVSNLYDAMKCVFITLGHNKSLKYLLNMTILYFQMFQIKENSSNKIKEQKNEYFYDIAREAQRQYRRIEKNTFKHFSQQNPIFLSVFIFLFPHLKKVEINFFFFFKKICFI